MPIHDDGIPLWLGHLRSIGSIDNDLVQSLSEAALLLFPRGKYEEAAAAFGGIPDDGTAAGAIAELGKTDSTFLAATVAGLGGQGLEPYTEKYRHLRGRFTDLNDQPAVAFCLQREGWIAASLLKGDQARDLLAKAREVATSVDDAYTLGYCYYGEALVEGIEGNPARALHLLTECERIRRSIGDEHGVGAARIAAAKMHGALGDVGAAVRTMETANDVFRALRNDYVVRAVSTHMGALAVEIPLTLPEPGLTSELDRTIHDYREYVRPKLADLRIQPRASWPG